MFLLCFLRFSSTFLTMFKPRKICRFIQGCSLFHAVTCFERQGEEGRLLYLVFLSESHHTDFQKHLLCNRGDKNSHDPLATCFVLCVINMYLQLTVHKAVSISFRGPKLSLHTQYSFIRWKEFRTADQATT